MLGASISNQGIYYNWSPLFNFNSQELLSISHDLPFPTGYKYFLDNEVGFPLEGDYSNLLGKTYDEITHDPVLFRSLVSLMREVSKFPPSGNVNMVKIAGLNEELIDLIGIHNEYELGKADYREAIKNKVFNALWRIGADIKNVVSATSPISMGPAQDAAAASTSGQFSKLVSNENPGARVILQYQNSIGKDGIGVYATGIKVFSILLNYYNEKLNKATEDNLNRYTFYNENSENKGTIEVYDNEGNKHIIQQSPTLPNVKVDPTTNPALLSLAEAIIKRGFQEDVFLTDSVLLSAATDNAKELILSKINAGPNLAGMYLHMIMLGFSFNDIAKFMTSPTVQTVNDLMKVNVFDEYHDHASVDSVVRALEEGPNIRNYFDSTSLGNFFKRVQEKLLDSGEEAFDKRGNWIQAIKDRFAEGDSIDDIFPAVSYREHRFLEEYKYLQKMKNRLDMDRFAEFKKVNRNARETELLGRFYGLNQGMPTDLGGKMSRLNTYESAITSREQLYKDDKYEKGYNPEVVIKNILNDKPYLSEEQVRAVVNDAVAQGITNGGFSMRKFLDPMNSGYKKSTIAYYNLIKGTWNIFDMIDKIPHFKALFEVYNLTDTTDVNISTKFNLVNSYREALIKENPTYGRAVTKEQLNALGEHVDDVLITGWLAKRNITFRMDEGQKYIGNDMTLHDIKEGGEVFSLATNDGIANFKLWMERTVIPELHNGMVGDKRVRSLLINQFVQGLSRNRRTDPFTRGNTTYMKLPIDMMNVRTESDQAMFSRYQKDFAALKRINLQGLPLTDWFFLYNLVVNKNKYGADRLTTLLNTFDKTDVSDLLIEYQKYVGQSDYDLDVNMDTFSLEDALIRMAPIISESAKGRARDKYIRMRNEETGRLELYERDGEDYYEVNDIPDPSNIDMRRLYDDYFVIRTPNQNAKMKELVLSRNDSMENIVNKIKSLMERNTIQIRINC